MVRALLIIFLSTAPLFACEDRDIEKYREAKPCDQEDLTGKSTWIERIEFCDGQALIVTMRSGRKRVLRQYAYLDVPKTTFDAMREAISPGGFYNRDIRGKFSCEIARDQR